MNIILWVFQIFLALHTAVGAVWKFSHSPRETMLSLGAIPQGLWLGMSVLELLCALCLILPALNKSLVILAPIAAAFIATEMLLFCGLHLYAGDASYGPVFYWLIVTGICAFIGYSRFVMKRSG